MFKIKLFSVCCLSLMLVGCATGPNKNSSERYTNEQLLESSGNSQELIKLYKKQLLASDKAQTRIKLVRAYIETKDYESAIFYIQKLIDSDQVTADAYFLYGKAKFGLNEQSQAQLALQKAIELDGNHGEALNLLGVIAAYSGDYLSARNNFTVAREKMFDDTTVKNNLAMVDLIEGKYQAAVEKLTPLLNLNDASPKVRSNLAFAYAKLGQYPQFEQLLTDTKLTNADKREVFKQLAKVELIAFEGPPEFLAGEKSRSL